MWQRRDRWIPEGTDPHVDRPLAIVSPPENWPIIHRELEEEQPEYPVVLVRPFQNVRGERLRAVHWRHLPDHYVRDSRWREWTDMLETRIEPDPRRHRDHVHVGFPIRVDPTLPAAVARVDPPDGSEPWLIILDDLVADNDDETVEYRQRMRALISEWAVAMSHRQAQERERQLRSLRQEILLNTPDRGIVLCSAANVPYIARLVQGNPIHVEAIDDIDNNNLLCLNPTGPEAHRITMTMPWAIELTEMRDWFALFRDANPAAEVAMIGSRGRPEEVARSREWDSYYQQQDYQRDGDDGGAGATIDDLIDDIDEVLAEHRSEA